MGETLRAILDAAERRLAAAGIESPRRDAQLLAAAALGSDADTLRFDGDRALSGEEAAAVMALVERRAGERIPVSRLLGEREFWSLPFRLTADTLDPRPDSETLVEAALRLFPDRDAALRVLDLGTGSGCLLLAVLHERPHATGLGIDASPGAVAAARDNAQRLGLAARAAFRQGDWGKGIAERFDLILCNPPYIAVTEAPSLAPEVARHDPAAALFGGADGLAAYRAIMPDLSRLLARDGAALLEIGYTQAAAVSALARGAGLRVLAIERDLGGRDRCVAFGA